MSEIKSFKDYCSFCRRDLTGIEHLLYNHDLVICFTCKEILDSNPVDETSPIVLFEGTPVLQSDAKVLNYFENELSLPLPPITLRNFLTEDESYGYFIEDNQVVGLGLDGSDLSSLSAIILNLTNLKFLSLKNNELTELPSFISSLTKLEILDLTKNRLMELPSLENLDKLNHLVIKDNLIESLPNLPNHLQSINARWNRIRFLENALPPSIKRLNIAQNQLQEVPLHFKNLTQLEELNLYGNQLRAIPEIFTDLRQLKILVLRVNKLEILPKSLESASSLEVFDMEENLLAGFLNFSQWTKLKILNISKNRFEGVLGIEKCVELLNLDIRDNRFSKISLIGLDRLNYLDISYNNFTSLPDGLENKYNLIELIASGNKIAKVFKSEINKLLDLNRLSLAKNDLVELPDLSFLPNLQELYLNDNKLEHYPIWLKKLKLTVLTLDNNSFKLEEELKEEKEIDTFKSLFE